MPRVRRVIDVDDAVKRYAAGESEQSIAKLFGCDRGVIRRRLIANGVVPRDRSAAMFTRMAKTTEAERLRLTEAAHDAVRGKPQSFEHRVKIATGRQRIRSLDHRSPIEVVISKMLAARGVPHTRNAAVGPYNVDFSLDPDRIAVEVFGGGWHASGAHADRFFKRTKYLLDRGWDVVIVWVDPRRFPIGPGVVDQIISSADLRRAYPSARSQYRVLLGNGDPAPALRSYFNDSASVQRFCGGKNRRR